MMTQPDCRTVQAGQWIGRAASFCLDLVLPPRCPACGVIVAQQGGFCSDCWRGLHFITAPFCVDCGLPFELPQAENMTCGRCMAHPPPYRARSPFLYKGAARDVILALKHRDALHLARLMAPAMIRAAGAFWAENPVIVPTPLHRWRLWRRGYNQSVELARAIARGTGAPLWPDALTRRRATRSSGGLSAVERRRNLRGAITASKGIRLHGRSIVLVDDVFTTGATAEACAAALHRAGAARILVLTYARVALV